MPATRTLVLNIKKEIVLRKWTVDTENKEKK